MTFTFQSIVHHSILPAPSLMVYFAMVLSKIMPRPHPHYVPFVGCGSKTKICVKILLQRSCEIQFSHHSPIVHNVWSGVVFGFEALDWLTMFVAIGDICYINAA